MAQTKLDNDSLNMVGPVYMGGATTNQSVLNVKGGITSLSPAENSLVQTFTDNTGLSWLASYYGPGSTLAFGTNPNGAGVAERMRIESTGNVNVGMNGGQARLCVADSSGTGTLRVQGSATNSFYGELYKNNSTGEFRITQADGGSVGMSFYTGQPSLERARIDTAGNLLVGATSATCHVIDKAVATIGDAILAVRAAGGSSVVFKKVTLYTPNVALSAAEFGHNGTTGRAINTGGTINASGADYAEYMTKAADCGQLAKGQIVGVDVDGLLTDSWAAAVSFLIKSTDPSYVGGDVWGTEAALGRARPLEPVLQMPAYAGPADPGAAPIAPAAPDLVTPVDPVAPADDAGDDAQAEYLHQLADHDAQLQENEALQAAYDQAQAAYLEQLGQHNNATAAYLLAQQEHAAALESEQLYFDAITYPAYLGELEQFNALLEQARQRVDRMAYCGQVPCNVLGAKPGDYVVPAPTEDGGIQGVLVKKTDMNLGMYMAAVGIVQNLLPDGRANVRVKVL